MQQSLYACLFNKYTIKEKGHFYLIEENCRGLDPQDPSRCCAHGPVSRNVDTNILLEMIVWNDSTNLMGKRKEGGNLPLSRAKTNFFSVFSK